MKYLKWLDILRAKVRCTWLVYMEFCGAALLDERVFRSHGGTRRRNDTRVHQVPVKRNIGA